MGGDEQFVHVLANVRVWAKKLCMISHSQRNKDRERSLWRFQALCLFFQPDVDALSLIDRGIPFQTATPEKERIVLQISMRVLGRMKIWDPYLFVDFENSSETLQINVS